MTDASPDLSALYDREFFRDYSRGSSEYAAACRFIAHTLIERLSPATAVDWGCGAGLHAAALAERGVDVVGVDGVLVDEDLRGEGVDIRIADLCRSIPPGLVPEAYDLSLCIDVLEHLDDGDSAAALDNICRGARLVVLSCAPPGQGGHHHVNERPRRYWVGRMREIGWIYDRKATGAMERYFLKHRDKVPQSWMYHNLCIYRPAAG